MKSILLLSFLAVASCTPLGWDASTGWYGTGVVAPPAQQASSQIALQIQQALGQNAVENGLSGTSAFVWNQGRQSASAQRVAQEVIHQALRARQGQTAEGIEELKQQLQQQSGIFGAGPHSVAEQVMQTSTVDAINHLQQHLQVQQSMAPFIQAGSLLAKTIEAAIEAQMVSDNVNIQQFGLSGQTSQQSGQVFQAKIQQLIDQSNIQEIQAEIARQQARVQQLQQQQQLINQQRQQIQVQQATALQSGQGTPSVVQLEQAQKVLQFHEQQLVRQQLARQLIIQQLQQALVEQQQQLQQDIVSEQVGQYWAGRQNPSSQGLQNIGGAQWPLYGYPAVSGSNWNMLKSSWEQPGRSWNQLGYPNTPLNIKNSWRQGIWSTQPELVQ